MNIPFPVHTVGWQRLVILLSALEELRGNPTKRSVLDFIARNGLIKLRAEDRRPYPSQNEPSWETDIAWSRKSGVIAGLIRYDDWNCWEISREGLSALQELFSDYRNKIDVRECFLWGTFFKKRFNENYIESENDRSPGLKRMTRRNLPDHWLYLDCYRIFSSKSYQTLKETAAAISEDVGFPVAPNPVSIAMALYASQNKEIRMELFDENLAPH